ncbi:MAG TPA: sulfotransferase [Actinomycetota bacterium]|nr:sulfotransferase [Actinomycetota bacterium]
METLERLVAQAQEQTGLDDLGDDDWREGLERLLDALGEARLNELGKTIVPGELVDYLSRRLRIVAWRNAHPAVGDADVTPPIVVVGQARTGTTILHDLLAQDPAARVPLAWEVDSPVPPPQTATYESDRRIEEAEAMSSMVDLVIPNFRAMHPIGPRLAQECVRITGSAFRSMIFPTMYHLPSYAQWLLHEADMAPAYRWHRAYLQHLQSEHPGERWVLKSPGHIWCLDALVAEYPDAVLIQTHRDPVRIISSISSLIALLRRLACDDPAIPEVAEEFAEYILLGVDRSVDARENGTVPADRVVDVQFRAFMADPFGTIRTVYERLGLELDPGAEARMRTFLDANPSDKHGVHEYTFADTGLDEGEMRERARRYQLYFDVPTEQV